MCRHNKYVLYVVKLTIDEFEVVFDGLHCANDVVLEVAEVAVEPVGDPVVVVVRGPPRHQVLGKLAESRPSSGGQPTFRLVRFLQYFIGVSGVHISVFFGQLEFVPVGRDEALERVTNKSEDE